MKLIKSFVAISTVLTAFLSLIVLVLVMFGYRPFVIKTQSMEPLYMQGSLCWVDITADIDDIKIGDALVYRSPANSIVLHRLVDIISSDASTIAAVMQGDAAKMKQNVNLSRVNYIGLEAFTITGLGYVVDILMSNHILWYLVGIFFILACIPWESARFYVNNSGEESR